MVTSITCCALEGYSTSSPGRNFFRSRLVGASSGFFPVILRAGIAVAARFFAFAAFSIWYAVEHLFKCSCQVMFSMSVDLRWSISVDAAHVSESLSPLLLSLLSLSLLLLSQSLIRKELSIHAFAS